MDAQEIPEKIRKLVAESRNYFPNALAEFIYFRSYSRWIDEEGRRETWIETVERYVAFMRENLGDALLESEYEEMGRSILEQKIMPSMRLMWSAGKAARATHVAAYNCSFIAPDRIQDFAEIMYLLMCGTGVGFSVERQTIDLLPVVAHQTGERLPTHLIGDSKEGWCDAWKLALQAWFDGKEIDFDYSLIRPTGSRLMTMGGRSAGPGPLKALFEFARTRILERQGKRLRSLDVHDVICKIGEMIVMGGVRRSALISLSDLDDEEMRKAKDGHFYLSHPERAMANNSAVYNSKPGAVEFLEEWVALAKSGTGERGIFNRGGLPQQAPSRRLECLLPDLATCGTNPCGEIILRSKQFCNLTEVIARSWDTEESLRQKIRVATILGTYQSMLTRFPYLSDTWRQKCEEERLLGVSITGQWDCPVVRDEGVLERLRDHAIEVNRSYAARFGIRAATAVTCVKPSGTVSQLVDSASGMHPRFADYYIRRVRISATDPLLAMLSAQKYPIVPEVGQVEGQATTYVIEFPVKAPEGSVIRKGLSARTQLEHWKKVKVHYAEHNPSVTISVAPDEWVEAAHWVYRNWDTVGGLSFLPVAEMVYQLAPFEEISQEAYEALVETLPEVDFSSIVMYEKDDWTNGATTLACWGGTCELDPDRVRS